MGKCLLSTKLTKENLLQIALRNNSCRNLNQKLIFVNKFIEKIRGGFFGIFMMTTGKIAKQANVTVFAVRHYTEIGLLKPSRNKINGYHIYRQSDVTVLRFIKKAKSLGFSLKEIAQILDEAEKGNSPCPMVREIVENRINENRQKIEQLQNFQTKIEKARTDWKMLKDGVPDGDSVCHLIESIADF